MYSDSSSSSSDEEEEEEEELPLVRRRQRARSAVLPSDEEGDVEDAALQEPTIPPGYRILEYAIRRNRLEPFEPEAAHVRVCALEDIGFDVEDMEAEYGFDRSSKQGNWLTNGMPNRVAAVRFDSGEKPGHLADESVVARAFGELRSEAGGGAWLELWYLGVRPQHAYNRSHGGRCWGSHGIVKYSIGIEKKKVRWMTTEGRNLTRGNAVRHVRGTPNPYATMCLVELAVRCRCTAVSQNPEIPCAKLFHEHYCHETHPGTLLVFRSLGFAQPPQLDHFAWAGTPESLKAAWTRVRRCLRDGVPAV